MTMFFLFKLSVKLECITNIESAIGNISNIYIIYHVIVFQLFGRAELVLSQPRFSYVYKLLPPQPACLQETMLCGFYTG